MAETSGAAEMAAEEHVEMPSIAVKSNVKSGELIAVDSPSVTKKRKRQRKKSSLGATVATGEVVNGDGGSTSSPGEDEEEETAAMKLHKIDGAKKKKRRASPSDQDEGEASADVSATRQQSLDVIQKGRRRKKRKARGGSSSSVDEDAEEPSLGSSDFLYETTTHLSARELDEFYFQFVMGIRMAVVSAIFPSVTRSHGVKVMSTYRLAYQLTEECYSERYRARVRVVQVKAFAPRAFEFIRRRFRVNVDEYLWTWAQSGMCHSASDGRSGSVFIFTSDKRYMLKTVSELEARWLLEILPKLVEHYEQNPSSLIIPYFGLYAKVGKKKHDYFVVMPSIFAEVVGDLDTIYDLKGSTANRISKSSILKDGDFGDRKLKFGSKRERFLEQVTVDAKFLEGLTLMDYSLLVGIQRPEESAVDEGRKHDFKKAPSCLFFVEPTSGYPQSSQVHEPNLDAPPPARSAMKRKRKKRRGLPLAQVRDVEAGIQKSMSQAGVEQMGISTPTLVHESVSQLLPKEMAELFHQQSDRMSDEFRKSNGGLMAPDGSELYVFGIIDYLQKYNRRKKLANFAKSLKGDKKTLSTVPPGQYQERFVAFLSEATE